LRLAYLGDANSIHLREWLGFFAGRGHEVTLLLPKDLDVKPGLPTGIAVERFEPFNHRRSRLLGVLDARRSLRGVLRRVRPDVLDAQYLTVNGWHAWMSGFHPYVVSVWGSDVLVTPRSSRRGGMYARPALRSADMVVGGSAAVVAAAVSLGARPERAFAIPYGIDRNLFKPGPEPAALRQSLGLADRRVVFSPRAMTALYRHGVVLEALARLPADVVAVMVGYLADPAELEAVRSKAQSLGVADRLIVVPSIDHSEMPGYYRLADVVVSVPVSDSTPLTLFEALACGRPVVASDLPAVREVMGRLDPQALVPADDPVATAAAVARILALAPAAREAAAEHGEALAAELADRERNLSRVEQLYRGLAAGSEGGRRGS
jgi:glycosyltransferase involved in cell wall biosynthesis